MLATLQLLIAELNRADVRYLVCGGLAVVAHGHLRVTHDIDLALALETPNLLRALDVLQRLGFRPHLPVAAEDFADPDVRDGWKRDKGMQVFSLVAPDRRDLVVDLFCELPFAFEPEWRRAPRVQLGPGFAPCPIVSLPTLRRMKALAGRPIDLDDLHHLPSPPDDPASRP
jgi:hypothetical protein